MSKRNCLACGSKKRTKRGFNHLGQQRYKCECGQHYIDKSAPTKGRDRSKVGMENSVREQELLAKIPSPGTWEKANL